MNPNPVTKICPICGKEFTYSAWRMKIQKTCSKECGHVKRRRANKICKYCGKEYYPPQRKSVYCSVDCANKAQIGHIATEEHRANLSKALKGKNAGENNYAYGKFGENSLSFGTRRTDECKKKMSELKKGKYLLENNPNWKGGKSFEPYPLSWTKELKTFIRKRDNFTCCICNKNGYDVHHIDYNKENCSPDNLITLCRSCHAKTHHNREYWSEYFKGEKVT